MAVFHTWSAFMQTFWSELGYIQLSYREPKGQAIPLSKD